MTKRLEPQLNKFIYQGEQLKPTLTNLLLVVLCAFLIVIATFTQFDFNHFYLPSDFWNYFGDDFSNPEIKNHFFINCRYIPQIPTIMFIVALLGRRFGMTSVILYIIAGLFFVPVFALGGGLDYIFVPGFGYIVAFLPSIFFSGSIIKDKLSFINILQAVIVGVLTIHLIGILYLLFISTIKRIPFSDTLSWLIAQSGSKIIYDIFFSYIAMLLAKLTKKILWVAMSPINLKNKEKSQKQNNNFKRYKKREIYY